jgi:hypothetical protein
MQPNMNAAALSSILVIINGTGLLGTYLIDLVLVRASFQ